MFVFNGKKFPTTRSSRLINLFSPVFTLLLLSEIFTTTSTALTLSKSELPSLLHDYHLTKPTLIDKNGRHLSNDLNATTYFHHKHLKIYNDTKPTFNFNISLFPKFWNIICVFHLNLTLFFVIIKFLYPFETLFLFDLGSLSLNLFHKPYLLNTFYATTLSETDQKLSTVFTLPDGVYGGTVSDYPRLVYKHLVKILFCIFCTGSSSHTAIRQFVYPESYVALTNSKNKLAGLIRLGPGKDNEYFIQPSSDGDHHIVYKTSSIINSKYSTTEARPNCLLGRYNIYEQLFSDPKQKIFFR